MFKMLKAWLHFEIHVLRRGCADTWRALKPNSLGEAVRSGIILTVTVVTLYFGGNAALASEEITVWGATSLGFIIAVFATFVFNLSIAPFRLQQELISKNASISERINVLSEQLAALRTPPEKRTRIWMTEGFKLMPQPPSYFEIERAAYDQEFQVYGRELNLFGRARAKDSGVVAAPDRFSKDIGWNLWNRLRIKAENAEIVATDGAPNGTKYVDLEVEELKFRAFAERLHKKAAVNKNK